MKTPPPKPRSAPATRKFQQAKAATEAADEHPTDAESDAGSGQPRYQQIARELKRGIADGTWPVGARLPTELELCERFGISRFTVRAAVRMLEQSGLITRRQRVGTVVIATPDDARYTHDISSAAELFQYAQDTELKLMYVGRIALGKTQAAEVGAQPGEEWTYAIGLRRSGGSELPLCVTRLYLNPVLAGIENRLRASKSAIYAMIEREYQRPIERIEQELQGVVLNADDAANLGSEPGAPALRIVRRYFGDDGRLLELAENVHPSDRFSYRMHLRK